MVLVFCAGILAVLVLLKKQCRNVKNFQKHCMFRKYGVSLQ